ncbi:nitrogenase component 1 [Sinanaerobacter sp. ZZT-01]|uniref:nitrogenase component 1 n=1 Tax=Sinanaerobacter sp. ZZT-01 TaxID=3111540 RepID=UPI002D775D37|nr:nitrogenase component 1 [Sinanaerobacter sp. ZZT-01]WRR93675.1 nitrogenase component 1 [Sinanaerobacter sp. ZZT-01]
MIELKHLKCLSKVQSNSGIGFLTPAAYPGKHCPMHTALALGARIKGMSTLVIGTSECATYSRNMILNEEVSRHALHYSYVLDANEVVFGFREGLMKALLQMEQEGANAVLVITTCVPEVIGEDIEGILWELRSKISMKVIHVAMGHFKGNSYPSGYWKTLVSFGELMEPVKEKSNTINVLGRSPDQEDAEPILLTALREAGFQLRMLAPKSDLQDFIAAPDAKLNLVLSPFMNPLAEWMHKHHNVPFISLHGAYKVSEIECVYLQICELLNIEWEESFEEGKKEAELLEKKAEAFQGMDYAITQMGAIDPLPLALYFADFQMRPILIHVEEFYPEDKNWRDKIVEKGYDPVICHMVNDRDDRAVLEYLCPDFYIGELELSKILGISLVQDLYGKCGYERTALLLRRMLSAYGGE